MIVVKAYEEQIMDALDQVGPKRRGELRVTHGQRQFDAIRLVLQPLYDRLKTPEVKASSPPVTPRCVFKKGSFICGMMPLDHVRYHAVDEHKFMGPPEERTSYD